MYLKLGSFVAVLLYCFQFVLAVVSSVIFICCFFNDTATTEIYTYLHTLSLHDALPISSLFEWISKTAALAIFKFPQQPKSVGYSKLIIPREPGRLSRAHPRRAVDLTFHRTRRIRCSRIGISLNLSPSRRGRKCGHGNIRRNPAIRPGNAGGRFRKDDRTSHR